MSGRVKKKQDTVSFEALQKHFDMPLEAVAEKFDMCCALLKKVCRRLGIKRWPYRQVSCIQNQIKKLEAQVVYYPNRSGTAMKQIDELKRKLAILYSNPNKSSTLVRENLSRGMETVTEDRLPNVVMLTKPAASMPSSAAPSSAAAGVHLSGNRKRGAPDSDAPTEVANAVSVLATMSSGGSGAASATSAKPTTAAPKPREAVGHSHTNAPRPARGSRDEGRHASSKGRAAGEEGREGQSQNGGKPDHVPHRSMGGPSMPQTAREVEVYTDNGPLSATLSFPGAFRGVSGTWVFVPGGMPPAPEPSSCSSIPRPPYPPSMVMPGPPPYPRMEDTRGMYPYPPPGYFPPMHARSGSMPPYPPADYMPPSLYNPSKRMRTN